MEAQQIELIPPTTLESVGSFLLGGFLDDLFDRTNKVIQNSLNKVGELELNAGFEISRAITQLKNAYHSSLNETVDTVSGKLKEQLLTLQTCVNAFEKRTQETLSTITAEAQQIANTLPFAHTQSQVRGISPSYVVPRRNSQQLVTIEGNFLCATKKGYAPTLTYKDQNGRPQECPLRENQTGHLSFEIPSHLFTAQEQENSYSCVEVTLSAPWDNGIIFSNKVDALFRLLIRSLPPTPGTIAATYTKKEEIEEKTTFLSPVYTLSGEGHIDDHWVNQIFNFPVEEGWEICSQAELIKLPGWRGDIRCDIRQDQYGVELHTATYAKGHEEVGHGRFQVKFDQKRKVIKEVSSTRPIPPLYWGCSQAIKPEAGETVSWISLTQFDGKMLQITGPQITPYLKVTSSGNIWSVEATIPKEQPLLKRVTPNFPSCEVKSSLFGERLKELIAKVKDKIFATYQQGEKEHPSYTVGEAWHHLLVTIEHVFVGYMGTAVDCASSQLNQAAIALIEKCAQRAWKFLDREFGHIITMEEPLTCARQLQNLPLGRKPSDLVFSSTSIASVSGPKDECILEIKGDFPSRKIAGCTPILTIGGLGPFTPLDNSTSEELKFGVRGGILQAAEENGSPEPIGVVELSTPLTTGFLISSTRIEKKKYPLFLKVETSEKR